VPYREVAAYVERHRSPSHLVFTTWHGIRGPVNHYLRGVDTAATFPGEGRVGADFWLLLRPAVAAERGVLEALVQRGWTEAGRAHFGDRYGTTAVLLSRSFRISSHAPEP
jgi:hypothetical protein